MRVGNALGAWLADRDQQRAARRAAALVATEWDTGPCHRHFAETLAAARPRSGEAVAVAVRALFADDSWVDRLVATLVEAMRRDPFFEPPFRHINSPIHQGLIVYEDELVSLAAGVGSVTELAASKTSKGGPRSIVFSGQIGLFKFVQAGGARISLWEAPAIADDFTAANAGPCARVGEREIADGDILLVDGRRQSFVIEHARSNLVVLQAVVKPDQAPVSVEYDSVTHAVVRCSAADDSASRIQMITTLLRRLDCAAAAPAIAEFLGHPNFFVRWHVMRELLGLDAEAAWPHLKRMAASDPHPETRRAARQVLERLADSQRKAA